MTRPFANNSEGIAARYERALAELDELRDEIKRLQALVDTLLARWSAAE